MVLRRSRLVSSMREARATSTASSQRLAHRVHRVQEDAGQAHLVGHVGGHAGAHHDLDPLLPATRALTALGLVFGAIAALVHAQAEQVVELMDVRGHAHVGDQPNA
jgi:hypothetical protein